MLTTLNVYSDDLIVFEGVIDKEFYDEYTLFDDALVNIFNERFRVSNKRSSKTKKNPEDNYG